MRCPACGRGGSLAPFDAVVRGTQPEGVAPVLEATWRTVELVIDMLPAGAWAPRSAVVEAAAAIRPANNATTAEQLVSAAARAGIVAVEYRTGGTPRRRRCWIRRA